MEEALRSIPQVSGIIEKLRGSYPYPVIKKAVREVVERVRADIISGKRSSAEGIYEEVEEKIKELLSPRLKKVINATGVVINTNLGRAPLHPDALEHVREVSVGYSNLEYDLLRRRRGSRNSHVEEILKELTGAESALIVNNNAGAVFLILSALAKGKEVIISRGELVEIGGSFRIPDIMSSSGARLREVGTTNRTRIEDYERAIGEDTALLMKVHKSNFYMVGFAEEVSLEELSSLGKRYGIPTYYDAGSGLLLPLKGLGEPSFGEILRKGIDVVSGSGDKLLGGPQAGIVLGRKEIVETLKKNPLFRVLRVDKMTIAALEKTLLLYMEGREKEIPVLRMLLQKEETIRNRAMRLRRMLAGIEGLKASVVKDTAKPGGGSLPWLELPTYCVSLLHERMSAQTLWERLIYSKPPVIGRVRKDRLLLDMRTVMKGELVFIKKALSEVCRAKRS
ncbi:MAG TPA: L-seryl-tRNA(Sec) selenium transferase [Aquificaceae bacterium]|nr:L-seryl-tRNA(Sec) selenium transferase [Aquificaceae bacterium]